MVEIIRNVEASPKTRKMGQVSVNGVSISRADIAREIQNHAAATPIAAWEAAARALVVRELLLAEAARLDLAPAPELDAEGLKETDEEALIRALLEQEVKVPKADHDTCQRYYDRNPSAFRTDDLHEVSHILLPAMKDDAAGRDAARESARAMLQSLQNGKATFEELALKHSACPSRELGGSLGQIGPGQTVPEFEAALAGMTPGTVHPAPVETRYGVHIVRVAHRIEGRAMPFDMVEDSIASRLEDASWHIAVRQYLTLLAGQADIRGIELEGASSPLVQ